MDRFTRGLAAELFADGIAVNAVAPVAAVRSEGAEALVGGLLGDEAFEPVDYLTDAIAYLAGCTADRIVRVRCSRVSSCCGRSDCCRADDRRGQ